MNNPAINLHDVFKSFSENPELAGLAAAAARVDETPLSPAEVELADRVAEPPLPLFERDAVLTAGDLRLDFTLRAYGRFVPQCGTERGHNEIDRVTLGGPDGEDEIYNALTPGDFEEIQQAANE